MTLIPLNIILFHYRFQQEVVGTDIELRLHDAVVRPFRKHGSICLRAHHKPESSHQNGLSGSGLSRNNDQTLRKIYFQRVYQNVIPYLKPAEHRLLFVLLCHPVVDFAFLELLDGNEARLRLSFVVF